MDVKLIKYGVDGMVWMSRIARKLKADQFVGMVRRRASLSYLTYLHEDVVHEMRKFALACECCGDSQQWNEKSWDIIGPPATGFCTACRKLYCDLAELEDHQIHCCLKSITILPDGKEIVETWARSEPISQRDDTEVHPVADNTVWSCLLGRNDGNQAWDLFNCFSSNNLVNYSEQFKNSRRNWQKYYKSTLVFPLRYVNRRGTTHFDTFAFLALDSKKEGAFKGMPEIFEHVRERDVFHDKARNCAMFQAGAAIADSLSMFLRPICIRGN